MDPKTTTPLLETNDFFETPIRNILPSTSGLQQMNLEIVEDIKPSIEYESDDTSQVVNHSESSHLPISSNKYKILDQYGHISTVKPGTIFKSRRELREIGVHRAHTICCFREEGLVSIILNDCHHLLDEGSLLMLSGYKSLVASKRWAMNNQLVSFLQENKKSKMPVRVIRSCYYRNCPTAFKPKKGYRYDGIYEVLHATYYNGGFYSILRRIVDHNEPPIPELNTPKNSPLSQMCHVLCHEKDKQKAERLMESLYGIDTVKNTIHPEEEFESEHIGNFKHEDSDCFEDTESEMEFEESEGMTSKTVFAEAPDPFGYSPTKDEHFSPVEPKCIFILPKNGTFEAVSESPEHSNEKVCRDINDSYTGFKYLRETNLDSKFFKMEDLNIHGNGIHTNDFSNMEEKRIHVHEEDPLKTTGSSPPFGGGKSHHCVYNYTLKEVFERIKGAFSKICPCSLSRDLRPMSEDFEDFLEFIFHNPEKNISRSKFERKFLRQIKRAKKTKSEKSHELKTPSKTQMQSALRKERNIRTKSKEASNPDMDRRSCEENLSTVQVDRQVISQTGNERTSPPLNEQFEETTYIPVRNSSKERTKKRNYRKKSRNTLMSTTSSRTPIQTEQRVRRVRKFKGQRELESLGSLNSTSEVSQGTTFPRRSPRKRCKQYAGVLTVPEIEAMDFEGFTDEEIQRVEKNFRFYVAKERPFKGFPVCSEEEEQERQNRNLAQERIMGSQSPVNESVLENQMFSSQD